MTRYAIQVMGMYWIIRVSTVLVQGHVCKPSIPYKYYRFLVPNVVHV